MEESVSVSELRNVLLDLGNENVEVAAYAKNHHLQLIEIEDCDG